MERSIPLRQVLGAATVQATRAAITGLIPLTLLALIGWASAGSSSGNTADALRGAGLLWLAAHHVAMDLTFDTTQADGLFSVLPIGLLVIPVLTLRGAGLRLARAVDGARVDILVFAAGSFAFAYSLVGTAVAFTVDTAAVRPRFLEAFAYALALALLAGGSRLLRISWPPQAQRLLRFFRLAFGSLLIGGAGLVLASLVVNFREALSIVSVLRL
jgi:hypothetical protein